MPPAPPLAASPAEPVVILEDRVQVWVARFPAGRLDGALREALATELDDGTRARLERFRTIEDRDRGLAAHALLRRLLGSAVGEQPAQLLIAKWCAECRTAEHGKPFLSGWGEFPPVQFNVSHAGDLVAVALAGPAQPIGVDVESRSRPVNWEALRRSVFARPEWEATAASPDPARARADAWSRKEACVKATGRGLATPLRNVVITTQPAQPAQPIQPARPPGPAFWRARIEESADRVLDTEAGRPQGPAVHELAGWDIAAAAGVDDGYAAAVAVLGDPASGDPDLASTAGGVLAPIVWTARL